MLIELFLTKDDKPELIIYKDSPVFLPSYISIEFSDEGELVLDIVINLGLICIVIESWN